MNILLLTSAMSDSDFASYQDKAKIKPNPSNQNFYSRLIKALCKNNNLKVVSLRLFKKGMFSSNYLEAETQSTKESSFNYAPVYAKRINKLLFETNDVIKAAEQCIKTFNSQSFIIVVDTLKISLVKAAFALANSHHAKIVGVLTDNPLNLSNKKIVLSKYLIKKVGKMDGYLSLTTGLVNVFNNKLPSYVFEGLVTEDEYVKKDPIYNYYFFAGSLYERYGVKTLVDAVCKSNIANKLVIAGNGPLAKYIEKAAEKDPRILYLTQLSKEKTIGYMKNSLANINPRPINKKFDSESVPSKLLEYLSSGVPTISTKYERLYGAFKDNVFWINGSTSDDIKNALEVFETETNEIKIKKASSARLKAFEFYGIDVQAESINHFLTEINSSTK